MANDRAERLKAQGHAEAETLADFQKRRNQEAFDQSGSQEDPGAAYQKAESKMGRANVTMPKPGEPPVDIGGGRKQDSRGFIIEPPTLKSIVGYSDEKKAILAGAPAKTPRKKGK